MALFKLKRGLSSNVTSLILEQGEPAYTLDTKKLYIGNEDGTKTLINPDLSNAESATKLMTVRNFSASGDAVAPNVLFDGTQNVDLILVLKNSGVTAGTYTKLTVNAKGIVTSATQLTAADIPNLTSSKITDLGTAAKANTGTASGNVPVLDTNGKLSEAVLPSIAITDVFEVATQAAMIALTAQTGDIAVRSDLNKSFILKASPANTLANWVELKTPTDTVLSINGRTGTITLSAADVGLGNVTNESKVTMFASAALTGNSTAVTQPSTDNSTRIATTAFVKSLGYLTDNSVLEGGTF